MKEAIEKKKRNSTGKEQNASLFIVGALPSQIWK